MQTLLKEKMAHSGDATSNLSIDALKVSRLSFLGGCEEQDFKFIQTL